jgi:DNA polymerase-3 subunit delta'
LFVGPAGAGKRDAAAAFAAALLCPDGGCGHCVSCRAAAQGTHPDLTTVERSGASVLVDDVRSIALLAQRTPTAGDRQVIILEDFHAATLAAPALLKTIEEPPESTTFIVVADGQPSVLPTIASRCVLVEFGALGEEEIVAALRGEGTEENLAHAAAAGAHGRLDRARLLVRDAAFAERQAQWRRIPERLDGTGATAAILSVELLSGCDALVAVVKERQAEEFAALVADAERAGGRLTGRQSIEARHNREQRRVRTDEIRAGLATLAESYRARLSSANATSRELSAVASSIDAIDAMAASLMRNPTEHLQLVRLFLVLDRVRS